MSALLEKLRREAKAAPRECLAVCDRAVSADPSAQAHTERGHALRALKDFDGAADAYEAARAAAGGACHSRL